MPPKETPEADTPTEAEVNDPTAEAQPEKGGVYDLQLPIDEAMLHEKLDPYGGFTLTVVDETATVTAPGLTDAQLGMLLQ